MLLAALESVCLDLVESLLMLPSLSFGGLVLWFSRISLLLSPSLSWGGVLLQGRPVSVEFDLHHLVPLLQFV